MDTNYPLLQQVNTPLDLKKFSEKQLGSVCEELRQYIIDVVSSNPGHLGASLGVVELTAALHYIFNSPYDKIIWDVGHQAYGHKILTGRRKAFQENRKQGGISGFPKMSESEHDVFGTGHSSTSVSAALGIALANQQFQGENNHVIAVIGDGSLTGGLAFEGLNNAGAQKANLLVILNDNNISIDPGVGALKEYLTDITASKAYNKVKKDVWDLLGVLSKFGPNAQKYIQKLESGVKSMLLNQGNMFEALNFRYFGPVDGHDVAHLTKILRDLKNIQGPKLLHVITKKGKGFKQAELNQTAYHAPGKFDKVTGALIKVNGSANTPPRYQDVFGKTLLELADMNEKIVGITPAMPTGCSMNIMMEKYPERTFDVGIAEQHAVTFSAGLASQGMVPYCNIYSSFMQRAYDQILHDVAIQNLHVVFCLDRAGLVGEDGPTHHGVFDIAYLRSIPNMIVAAPMDEEELRNMLYTAQVNNCGPIAIRYPRKRGVSAYWQKPFNRISIGKGEIIREGGDIAVLTLGHTGNFVKNASVKLAEQGIEVAHYNMRFVKPLDEVLLRDMFKKFKKVITVEDGTIVGGFGSAVIEYMSEHGYSAEIKRLGVPDRFIEHGELDELYRQCGFDENGIIEAVKSMLKSEIKSNEEKYSMRLT